jgi:hypothetical protein
VFTSHVRKLHRIVDRQTRRHTSARRIDVKVDVLLRIGHLQEQQLRDDRVGHHVIDRRAQKHDAID